MPAVLNKKGGSLCWVKMQIQNIYLFASLLFVFFLSPHIYLCIRSPK